MTSKELLAASAALLLVALSYCETWQHRPFTAVAFFVLSALAVKVGRIS